MDEKLNIITYTNPKSPLAEAYRLLRTNLQFSQIDKELKTIAITSSLPNEGKSTIVTNLAIALAQADNKVLVIDCDLRNPTQHKNFRLANLSGFSDCIATHQDIHAFIQPTKVDNVALITGGTIPPNPSELLGSKQVPGILEQLKQEFDYIIIDTPPIMPVTDAALLSTCLDGLIMIVAYGAISPAILKESVSRITKPQINLLGIVLNKVDASSSNSYDYSNYKYYGRT